MSADDFLDAAIVVLGHGSTKSVESGAPVYQHAGELRRRNLFAEVREAFWKQEPQMKEVLAGLSSRRVFIAPLLVSEGYFGEQVIPRELGLAGGGARRKRGGVDLIYCQPVGTHPRMGEVLLARARQVTRDFPFPRPPTAAETTLFIAGHGTRQYAHSRQAITRQAERLRGLREFADVRAIFLEETPRIGECYALARTRNMIVVPFFISEGMHTREDIPVLLGETQAVVRQQLAAGRPTWRNPTEKRGKLVWLSAAAGTAPEIVEIILDRVREAARTC